MWNESFIITCPTVIKSDLRVVRGNLFISNGERFKSTNGKGNLIIGQRRLNNSAGKTCSHNLVIGPQNSYTSFGGFAMGEENHIAGAIKNKDKTNKNFDGNA